MGIQWNQHPTQISSLSHTTTTTTDMPMMAGAEAESGAIAATIAAAAAIATTLLWVLQRGRLRAAPPLEAEAYSQPAGEGAEPDDAFHQQVLHRSKSALRLKAAKDAARGAGLARQKSVVDDHKLAWSNYIKEPSTFGGVAGFNAAGVQRIDLPGYAGHEFERVADFLDGEAGTTLGLAALGKLHRLGTAERRAAWRAQFGNLDLGTYDEATSTGRTDRLCWTILLIQPQKSFPVHQHPDIEVEFVLRGALYENRLLDGAQPNAPLAELDLPDGGYPKLFRVKKHEGGSFFSNPRFSVHQSYTMDEGVAILVLWTGRHTNISDRDSKLWDTERCSNPGCPLMCDGPKTFADFIELGKHRF